jgi:hypothetical protein
MDSNLKTRQEEMLRLHTSSIQGHRPGRTFQFSDGSKYEVTTSGAWKRITKRECEKSLNENNNSVRRRKNNS